MALARLLPLFVITCDCLGGARALARLLALALCLSAVSPGCHSPVARCFTQQLREVISHLGNHQLRFNFVFVTYSKKLKL